MSHQSNVSYAVFDKPKDDICYGNSSKYDCTYLDGYGSIGKYSILDDPNNIGKCFSNGGPEGYLYGFPPGTSLEEAQDQLGSTHIIYSCVESAYESIDVSDCLNFYSDKLTLPLSEDSKYILFNSHNAK